MLLCALLCLVSLGSVSPASAQDESPAATLTSNERGRTYWSHILRGVTVRAAPNRRARARGKLRQFTFSGTTDVVVVLEHGARWSHVRYQGIGRRTGWVPTSALSRPRFTNVWVLIEKNRRRITAYRGTRRLMSAPVGIGASGSPTPGGQFFIRERIVPAGSGSIYGALAFGLSAYSRHRTDWPGGGQVGVHGTNQPGLIPGRISNGCVRMRNGDVRRLGKFVGPGTPVRIR